MPANDKEVFEYFRRDPATSLEVDFLAYASYAYDKYAWMARFNELHKRDPSPAEIDSWISQLPNSRLDEIQEWAVDYFAGAARAFTAEETKREVERGINASILTEVRTHNQSVLGTVTSATSFKSTWWQQLLVGIIASFVFAVLIILASAIFARDPSPLALYKGIVGEPTTPHQPPRSQ
jgi:hypothetical protein